jgi:tetratricopeptide (TPR) repeat protein
MTTLNKYHTGALLSIALLFFFPVLDSAFAETKVFVEEYTYQASEADSKLSSRVIALEHVKRLLLEKLGTYLESETEVKHFLLTKDQIVTLTAGIVTAEIIDEKWDGKTYYLRAKITADPKGVTHSIDKLRQDRQKTKELEETRKRAIEASREIEKLKTEIGIIKNDKERQEEYRKAVDKLDANAWFEKGVQFLILENLEETINAFNKVIELDPRIAGAYVFRGIAYGSLGNMQRAIKDYDNAINIDPKLAPAYSMRGISYGRLGIYRQAVKDCDIAIELDPKLAISYYNRGAINVALDKYQRALMDFNMAIEIDPKFAAAYSGRGAAYRFLGDYQQALRNSDIAIGLDPKDQLSYYNKGLIYEKLGNFQLAIENYKIAARLGYKHAQDYLRSVGIRW